jgi:hypothetical protein
MLYPFNTDGTLRFIQNYLYEPGPSKQLVRHLVVVTGVVLASYQLKCLSTIHLNSHANYAYFPVQAHCFVLSNIALEFVYLFILR